MFGEIDYFKEIFFFLIFRMDTYGKCGDLNSARKIFDQLKIKTKPSISSMSKSYKISFASLIDIFEVNIYGINSQALEAVELFYETKEKLKGNMESILISVLNACAHGGLVKEAQKIFDDIPNDKRSIKMWNTLVRKGSFVSIFPRNF